MVRPIGATINQKALYHNLSIVRKIVPKSHIWAVVKANAYGHGLNHVWQSLIETDGFALLNIEDAIFLREQGWEKPILLLEGFFQKEELLLIDYYRLSTTVHNNWQIQTLLQVNLSTPIDVYLKINCGMNRLGFPPKQIYKAWKLLNSSINVKRITLMTHFANFEEKEELNRSLEKFKTASKGLNCQYSISNSGAILWHPETHFDDWVRPGIILYGASPRGDWRDVINANLQPVMTLNSEIISIRHINIGEGVGYGYHYYASHKQRIGTVACGYADGYPRHAPTGTPVCVEGIRTKILGAISMDMIIIDLDPCPQANIGSKVELWGNKIKIDEVAKIAGTIGYELMCSLAPRVSIKITK